MLVDFWNIGNFFCNIAESFKFNAKRIKLEHILNNRSMKIQQPSKFMLLYDGWTYVSVGEFKASDRAEYLSASYDEDLRDSG